MGKLHQTSTHQHTQQNSAKMAGDKPEKKQNGLTKPLNLSAELAAIVGAKKDQKLQDPENKQYFTPDEKMAPVFGTEKIKAFGMAILLLLLLFLLLLLLLRLLL